MGAVVSTCSPRSSPCLWLPWLLARLLSQQFLETSPDLSQDLLLLLPGGLHRLPTLVSLLTMWARGKLLSGLLVFLQPLALTIHSVMWPPLYLLDMRTLMDTLLECLLLLALDILTARIRRPRI